ncbi:MAG: hypothetical protein R3F61_26895 [Myxococcota bacterium]
MSIFLLTAALAAPDLVESCVEGPERSAVVFCQELSPEEQDELLQRYRSEPTQRLAMLLGLQQQPAFDFDSLVRAETDSERWYALTWGDVARAQATPNRHLRRWLRSPDERVELVVELMDARGLEVPERVLRGLAGSEAPGLRSLAVERLTGVDEAMIIAALADEEDEGVRLRWADHAFALSEEPVALRGALTAMPGWRRTALDAEPSWARQWVVDGLSDPNGPDLAWLIRQMSDDPPPELWAQCGAQLARPRSSELDERDVQMACVAAWRVRTGRADLTFDEAAELSAGSDPAGRPVRSQDGPTPTIPAKEWR